MPELQDRPLGTSPQHKVLHAVAQTGSRLVGDRFLANYLADCLHMVGGLGPIHKVLLADAGHKRRAAPETVTRFLAQADDNIRWAGEMQAEDYHRVNVLAFLSLWSAYESGTENIVAAAMGTISSVAASAAARFSRGRYDMDGWPWSDEQCLEIAQKLDQKAKADTPDGGWDVAARLTTLFGWLGAELAIPSNTAKTLNEASMVRNVLLHRYGRMGPRDIERAPHLNVNGNNAVQITRERLVQYSQAVNETHVAVMEGVVAAGWE
ncbi:hypothetical protein [Ottowia sp. SB7-C50]|jgi:hypothetical protein|uniref:hypothetical protein n=1 Tax=Ottowia sp. SB7-C50 TaxID=3081231 RepID=UPI0029555FE2|nr:hypothetical protein [Ottowia sp. SB7-C50]WOP14113.1 hypothetical protein R0D99_09365 [Ottowia sp. SB7-C50]